jgi:hypothetical protein
VCYGLLNIENFFFELINVKWYFGMALNKSCFFIGAICSAATLELTKSFLNIIIRLLNNTMVKVEIGLEESELESSIGFRQGSKIFVYNLGSVRNDEMAKP